MGPLIGVVAALPLAIIGVIVGVGWALGASMGWYALAERFPDRPSPARRVFAMRSATMRGGVNINNALTLGVCDEGMRFSVPRLFLPFCKPFLVPWSEIAVTRSRVWIWQRARLGLGRPEVAPVTIAGELADAIGRAAPDLWPEPGPFPLEPADASLTRVAIEWAVSTTVLALMLLVMPWLASHGRTVLPLGVVIGVPAAAVGLAAMLRYQRLRQA